MPDENRPQLPNVAAGALVAPAAQAGFDLFVKGGHELASADLADGP